MLRHSFVYTFLMLLLVAVTWGEDVSAIKWETNMDDPPLGDPAAIKGGTLHDYLPGYPKTFRLYGPSTNELFANWTRPTSIDIGLVMRHPTTDNIIPILATHWFVADDHKTIYFKLDPDARWSDGEPITADDYVYTKEFYASPLIRSPFQNQYVADYIEDVQKIDDYTLKIIGKQPSWRPLEDYALSPVPKHATHLSETWVEDTNYTPPVVQGPYTITEAQIGQRVVFTRNADWWGNKKHYFQGAFNVDRIELTIIQDQERVFDYFKKGQLDMYTVGRALEWATQMNFDALNKGWVHRKIIYRDTPQGMSGIAMNLQKPIFQNRDFRKALQYLFNFDELNTKIMYGAYFRMVSAFSGTQYANPDLKPYGFNPKKAVEHLRTAGYTKRGSDGVLVNEKTGERASFTLYFGTKTFEPHLNIVAQTFLKAGVEMKLQLLEPVAMFQKISDKAFEAASISMTGGFYPNPHEYFASEFADKPQTNNFWGFASPEADALIKIYRFDMDFQQRKEAMYKLDAMIQDEAFYIPFWTAPYTRVCYWDYMCFPSWYIPKRANSMMEYQVFWIDPAKKTALEQAMKAGQAYPQDTVIEVDPYGTKAALDAAGKPATAEN